MLDGSSHGVYNASPPTINAGDTGSLQLDINGNLKVVIVATLTAISQGLNINPRVVTSAGAVTLVSTDYCVIIKKTIGAATTIDLPANILGETFVIVDGKGDAAANNITIAPASGTINGGATYIINNNYGSITLLGDGGTNWLITAKV